MSIEELTKAVDEMKAQGQSEEEIAGAYYLLFRDGKIDLEQLEALVNHLGFELSDEFKAMDPEQQKEAGYEVLEEEDGEQGEEAESSDEEIEDEEEDEEDEAMKLFGENKKQEKTSEPKKEEEEIEDEDEDEEKKAMKFFN